LLFHNALRRPEGHELPLRLIAKRHQYRFRPPGPPIPPVWQAHSREL
jgi:hypothetical protein